MVVYIQFHYFLKSPNFIGIRQHYCFIQCPNKVFYMAILNFLCNGVNNIFWFNQGLTFDVHFASTGLLPYRWNIGVHNQRLSFLIITRSLRDTKVKHEHSVKRFYSFHKTHGEPRFYLGSSQEIQNNEDIYFSTIPQKDLLFFKYINCSQT